MRTAVGKSITKNSVSRAAWLVCHAAWLSRAMAVPLMSQLMRFMGITVDDAMEERIAAEATAQPHCTKHEQQLTLPLAAPSGTA